MSRRLTEKYRKRLAAETGGHAAPWGGRLTVALVYPNTYHQGMSNLGFQTVYEWLNAREDSLCERFFLPDPEDMAEYASGATTLLSLESQRRLDDFDLIAFSISFENDYLHLPTLFELAHLPLWRAERDRRSPLVLCGGVCAFLNPEPLADIMDLFAVGEAEVILPHLLEKMLDRGAADRRELLQSLTAIPGVYVPEFYRICYAADGCVKAIKAVEGAPARVQRQWLGQLDGSQSRTCINTPDTEFASMNLLEISRGCPRGCRFCAAGFIYLPFREHSAAHLLQQVAQFGPDRHRIGLVGAAVSDCQGFTAVGEAILEGGGEVSVSSVRLDSIDAAQVSVLARSGHKTLALAPEAGSQTMRNVINKQVDEEQILHAVQLITEGGIPNLKLYFMIGLPGETEQDIEAIWALSLKIRQVWQAAGRKRGRLGHMTLSINPFVPKPFTPLQWAPMAPRPSLEKKYRYLQRKIRPLANVGLNLESLRLAELQALLARGDRRCGHLLPALSRGVPLRKACRELGLEPAFYLSRERAEQEVFPWEVIDQGVTRTYLWQEYCQALAATGSRTCQPGCRRCGVC